MAKHRSPAADRIHAASRIRAEDGLTSAMAAHLEDQSREKLDVAMLAATTGGELVPHMGDAALVPAVLDTLAKPDQIAADASRDRLDLLDGAGALAIGLDTADTIQPRDSLERMLAHQLAALHGASMKMAGQMNRLVERMDVPSDTARASANVEATRLAGAVSRMSATFQQGMITLQRVRSGGRQHVVVQHVNVADGGQALAAGQVAGPGGRPGGVGGSN